jgi:hypothetical protein
MQVREGAVAVEATLEDARYVISMLDSLQLRSQWSLYEELRRALEGVELEQLSTELLGWTDPIGQLAAFIYEKLREVASWFASTVSTVVQNLWSAFISPALSAIGGAVSGVQSTLASAYAAITSISSTVTSILSKVTETAGAVARLLSEGVPGIISFIAQTRDLLAKAVADLAGSVAGGIAALSKTLQGLVDAVSRLPGTIVDAVSKAIAALQSAVQSGFAALQGAVAGVAERVGGVIAVLQKLLQPVFDAVGRGFAELGRYLATLGQALAQVGAVIQGFVNAVLQLPERMSSLFGAIAGAIETTRKALENFFRDPVGTLQKAFQDMGKWIWERVPDWLKGALVAVQDFLGKLWTWLTVDAPKAAARLLEDAPRWFAEQIPRIWEALKAVPPLSLIVRAVEGLAALFDPQRRAEAVKALWEVLKAIPLLGIVFQAAELLADLFDPQRREQAARALWEIFRIVPPFSIFIRLWEWLAGPQGKPEQGPLATLVDIAPAIGSLTDAVKDLASKIWESLPSFIRTPLEKISQMRDDVWTFLTDTLPSAVKGFVEKVGEFAKDPFGNIAKWLGDLGAKLRERIWSAIPEPIRKALEAVGRAVEGAVRKLAQWVARPESFWDDVANLINFLAKWLLDVTSKVWCWFQGLLQGLAKQFASGAAWLMEIVSGAVGNAISTALGIMQRLGDVAAGIRKQLAGVLEMVFKPLLEIADDFAMKVLEGMKKAVEGEGGEWWTLMFLLSSVYLTAVATFASANVFGTIAEIGGQIREALEKIAEETPGIGGALAGILRAILAPINQAFYWMARAARELAQRAPEVIMFGLVFHWMQPIARLSNLIWKRIYRWMFGADMPIELPSASEMDEVMRRMLPALYGYEVVLPKRDVVVAAPPRGLRHVEVEIKPEELFRFLTDYYDMYGYPDLVSKILSCKPEEFYLKIRDRFGAERKVPLGSIYELPSFSDIARMMVRDLFGSVRDFEAMAAARGHYRDIAQLYYIFHFRYPPLEKVWEFYTRALAGLLWFRPTQADVEAARRDVQQVLPPEKAAEYMPVAPADLNALGKPQVAQRILDALSAYVKWYDYAPWAWVRGFTSDKWLMIDMLADIPQRIDTRWMYKWMVPDYVAPATGYPRVAEGPSYSEQVLGQIVIARAMNPIFVPMVSIAEMMNALTEERTVFRTGIINAFRRCFTTIEKMEAALGGLFTLDFWAPVWNPSAFTYEWRKFTVPVRFLPGEAKLLITRALYDRADIFYRDIRRQLLAMTADNMLQPDQLVDQLKKLVDALNEGVAKLAARIGAERAIVLQYDDAAAAFDRLYAQLRRDHATLRRARIFLRSVLYRLWQRFAAGYVSDEEIAQYVDMIVRKLKLTDYERDFFLEVAKVFRELQRRQVLAKSILKKVKRGEMGVEQAVAELVKLGYDEATAKAEVEAEVKEYVPSIDRFATLVELVPEAWSMFDRVMDRLGVPAAEREYWRLYVQRKAVKDEVSRLVTEMIYDYAKGIVSDAVWQRFCSELKKFGYTDEELQLLTLVAQLRRIRYAVGGR